MDIKRAEGQDLQYLKYKESLIHNTAFTAKENDIVKGIFEYRLQKTSAQILNISFHHSLKDKDKLFAAFINELFYWNPYVTAIIAGKDLIDSSILSRYGFKKYERWIYENERASHITKLLIDNIIPEQLTVNIEKVKNAATWIKSPKDIIVAFVYINGKPIVIDGYSRLTAAYYKNFDHVYGYIEKADDDMMKFYTECLRWCREADINSIKDLSKKLVTPEEHEKIWVGRCSNYFKNLK